MFEHVSCETWKHVPSETWKHVPCEMWNFTVSFRVKVIQLNEKIDPAIQKSGVLLR